MVTVFPPAAHAAGHRRTFRRDHHAIGAAAEPVSAGEPFSDLAEACVRGLAAAALREVERLGGRMEGRVAVVAFQGWVRAGSRLESAMLPNLRYRVYEPDERAEALAWVMGVGTGASE